MMAAPALRFLQPMSLRLAARQLAQRLAEGAAEAKGEQTKGGKAPKKARRKKAAPPQLSGVEKARLSRKAKDNTALNLRLLK